MRRNSLWSFVYWGLGCLQWTAGISVAIIGACSKADANWWMVKGWPVIAETIAFLQNIAPVSLLLMISIGITSFVRREIGPAWVWAVIQRLLEARGETPFRACSPFSRGESDREV